VGATKWECERCGWLSPPVATTCASCGERRDVADASPRRSRSRGPGLAGWVALVVSGVALSLSLGLAASSFTSLPLLVPIAIATAIVCRAYGVRDPGGWVLAFVLVLGSTALAGIAVGFLFLTFAGR
jgi:hypothetical protein